MHHKLTTLAERRQKLILKAASQRLVLAQSMMPLRQPLIVADRGLQVVRYFKQHPVLMLSVTTLSAGLMRRLHIARFSALLKTGWSVFQLVRSVRQSLAKD
ncbi:MAG: YqjK family protein [Methylotenera sp.]|nr:YqjK family protein [Methylotenera sp.]MDD4926336.1 YqjK family protein [Methylotenera sp.]